MTTNGIHHVAYRCNNAKETVDFYLAALDMERLAIAEDKVPSTGEPDPYVHVFLDAGDSMFCILNYRILQRWAKTQTPQTGCSTSHSMSMTSKRFVCEGSPGVDGA